MIISQFLLDYGQSYPELSNRRLLTNRRHTQEDLHVVWLDLANAFGSFPHQLITYALSFFHVPPCVQNLVAKYFNNLHICYTTRDITTDWHQLEKGIAMGCAISPILFTVAFEILLIGGRQMVRGVRAQTGQRLPAMRCYMDDVTTLLQTAACTARLLKQLEELLAWARMKIKPPKSRSLSIRKGTRNNIIVFTVASERIPLLVEAPVRSLGRMYTADLSDKNMASAVTAQLQEDLHKIDQCPLPGKFKVWCYQFTLFTLVPPPNVAPETQRHHHEHGPEAGGKGQQLHPEVARPSSIPLLHGTVREKRPPAPTTVHKAGVQKGEGEAPL
ncbi:uncharacterized protein LOC111834513 [Xyrichtys novacula]|uniref:Uncharacterized protein LOC111834513 n=1 Tax=Xyrichtys novacula TaxID=13765 RepID=A0AAV1GDZ2_XYRNO|nr:uncharacterized protein LOC111834513 [Xyrichtys novacula]